MLVISEYIPPSQAQALSQDNIAHLTLSYDDRLKTRQRVVLDNQQEAGLQLPRGKVLRGGDLLRADNGDVIKVCAADESVSTVKTSDSLLLSRICYHLGNRHVPLQITPTYCRFQHDHVLDDMVKGLGGDVIVEMAPFEPESGAYVKEHSHGSSASHSDSHSKSHKH